MGLPDPEASTGQILLGNLTGLVLDPVGWCLGWLSDFGGIVFGGGAKLPKAPEGTRWTKAYYIGWEYDWRAGSGGFPVPDLESARPVLKWDDPSGSDKSAGILEALDVGLPVARVHVDELSGAHILSLWGFNPQGYPLFSNKEQSDLDNLAAIGKIYAPLKDQKHYNPAGDNAAWCLRLGIDPDNPVISSSGQESRPDGIRPELVTLGAALAGFIFSGGSIIGAIFGGLAGGLTAQVRAPRRPSRSRGST